MNNIVHICDYCQQVHYISKKTSDLLTQGKQKSSFCSNECKSNSQHTGSNVTCNNCGKVFYRRKQHQDRSEFNFCSTECSFEYKKKVYKDNRECLVCKKPFITTKGSTKRFCSNNCVNIWQTTRSKQDIHNYKENNVNCTYCNKVFHIPEYRNSTEHHFCSIECRQKWYAEVWSQREEIKERSRKVMLHNLSSEIINTDTKPQQIVNDLLNKMNINYINEQIFDFYAVDNYLVDSNLIIEVQGDYWHCNINKFSKISSIQAKGIRKDKSKRTFIRNKYGIDILYLWENDIIKNTDKCQLLIQKYVDCNGQLDNYHSFNYSVCESKITLNNNIIVPYQEQNYNQYKSLIIQTP